MTVTWTDYYNKDYKDVDGTPITCSEWYETHDSAKPYRDRVMKALNQLRFKSAMWKPAMEMELDYRDLNGIAFESFMCYVNDVRKLAGMPPMSENEVRDGLKYRYPFNSNDKYEWCLEEMWLLCWYDW